MTATPQNISGRADSVTQSAASVLDLVREKARLLRIHSMRMTTAAGSGHPTSCLSCAELMAATFFHAMHFDIKRIRIPFTAIALFCQRDTPPRFFTQRSQRRE